MTNIIYISKKPYIVPLISFDEIEEDVEILAGTRTEATGGGQEFDPNDADGPGASGGANDYPAGAKQTDFVFEVDLGD